MKTPYKHTYTDWGTGCSKEHVLRTIIENIYLFYPISHVEDINMYFQWQEHNHNTSETLIYDHLAELPWL